MRRVERIWLGKMLTGIFFFLIFVLIGTAIVERQLDTLTLNHESVICQHIMEVSQQAAAASYRMEEEVCLYYNEWIKEAGDYFKAIL